MTYEALTEYATGAAVPAAQWNLMRGNQEWLTGAPICSVTRLSSWTVPSTPRYGPFTAAPVDTHGFWDPDAPTLVTIPTGCDGTYLITGWHDHQVGSVSNPSGGPIVPGTSAMTPYRIISGSPFTMYVSSQSLDAPYQFAVLTRLTAGQSVALRFDVTPIDRFGLMLQWMRPNT